MMRGSLLLLLRSEQVQKELNLSEDQINKLSEIGEKIRADMGDQLASLRDIENREQRSEERTPHTSHTSYPSITSTTSTTSIDA